MKTIDMTPIDDYVSRRDQREPGFKKLVNEATERAKTPGGLIDLKNLDVGEMEFLLAVAGLFNSIIDNERTSVANFLTGQKVNKKIVKAILNGGYNAQKPAPRTKRAIKKHSVVPRVSSGSRKLT